MVIVAVALLNGSLLSLQQVLNAALGKRVGVLQSSIVNHVVGAVFAGLLLVVGWGRGEWIPAFAGMTSTGIPWIYFLGGCLGVCAVAMANYAIPRIGAAAMAMLFMTSQLAGSSLIDHFGWLGAKIVPVTLSDGLGIVLLLAGAVLVLKRE